MLWVHFAIDFSKALYAYRKIKRPTVTFFGSGMVSSDHAFYTQTHDLAEALGQAGYGILTGGGPGLMRAANEGAVKAEGDSYTCRIALRTETASQTLANTVDHWVSTFWLRKLFLIRPACAYIVVPGGFGTLDETFEVLTLLRTAKLENKKVIFYLMEYWQPLRDFIEHKMLAHGLIDAQDMDWIVWAESSEQVITVLDALNSPVKAMNAMNALESAG
jgi:uncharacterized protein (TIGR00730 family)